MLITDEAALAEAWPRLGHHLERALARSGGTHGLEDVRREILAGRQQLWAGDDAAIVTQVLRYPRMKSVNLFLMGGTLEEIKQMEKVITSEAQAAGVARVQLGGRRGWLRELPDYRQIGVVLVKDL